MIHLALIVLLITSCSGKSRTGERVSISHLLLSASLTSAPRKVEWNTLKLRWGTDPLVSNDETFVRQPRTIQQAMQENYEKLPNGLGDQCVGNASRVFEHCFHRDLKGKPVSATAIGRRTIPVPFFSSTDKARSVVFRWR
jgi:hypothetical protein